MKGAIAGAGIDTLYTTGEFREHMGVIPDFKIWKDHADDVMLLHSQIVVTIAAGDKVFIKGTPTNPLAELAQRVSHLKLKEE
ncbi:MAG: hypothetical protein HQL31_09340 [Planctomycetes bacterium]|nr:hypothetical protein [Planctomycetota bacterium]